MKKILILFVAIAMLLCSCNSTDNRTDDNTDEIILAGEPAAIDKELIGKWIDVETEKIHEYTFDGYYYEWINEGFTSEKTRYIAKDGFLTIYLDSARKETEYTVPYEINDEGNLIISGEIEYRLMNIKTSTEEME